MSRRREWRIPRSRECNHVLRLRVGMPTMREMRRCLLEVDRDHVSAILFVDRAFDHMRSLSVPV